MPATKVTTLMMMQTFAADFPELWENAYNFCKISDYTLLIHTGSYAKDGTIIPCVMRFSMFDPSHYALSKVKGA
jgi:hypothetical protein